MELVVIGIDYHTAPLALREQAAVNDTRRLHFLRERAGQGGTAVLSTCNRTELYLCSETPLTEAQAQDVFCACTQMRKEDVCGHLFFLRNTQAETYLFQLACGLHSMILGEDQIITQLGDALAATLATKAGNPALNTLLRHAVTCAKKAKAQVNVRFISPSIVSKALEIAAAHLGTLQGKRVLIIGNGEMGRLAARTALAAGANVCMTVRTYKHKDVEIPKGCETIAYDNRAEKLATAQVVISATKSPHYTLTPQLLAQAGVCGGLYLDLALPRDIDPDVQSLPGVVCYDVDSISQGESAYDTVALAQIEAVITAQQQKFAQWLAAHSQTVAARPFPLFFTLEGRSIVVVGGGKIAARRITALLASAPEITVVAPQICAEITRHQPRVICKLRAFQPEDIDGAFVVLAATDDAAVNSRVAALCHAQNIPVNVADDKTQCDFYFPAVLENDTFMGGIVSKDGSRHTAVKQTARALRAALENTAQ